jgi:DNA gyrase/topoisomerase IV subunit B
LEVIFNPNYLTQPRYIATGIDANNIEITIEEDGTIIMLNDGNGIDVAEHPEHKIWIPELIFGHLRTSTNYDKTEKKIVKVGRGLLN